MSYIQCALRVNGSVRRERSASNPALFATGKWTARNTATKLAVVSLTSSCKPTNGISNKPKQPGHNWMALWPTVTCLFFVFPQGDVVRTSSPACSTPGTAPILTPYAMGSPIVPTDRRSSTAVSGTVLKSPVVRHCDPAVHFTRRTLLHL